MLNQFATRCLGCQRGVTLIELMVGLAIFSLLVALAVPSYSAWIQNTQIRTAAESIVNGLQLARNEALRRNRSVELILTADAPLPAVIDSIVPAQGTNWMVRVFEASDTYTPNPDFVQAWAGADGTPNARLSTVASGAQETFRFSPLGRASFYKAQVLTASPLLRTELRIEVTSSAASCKPGAGDLRCLTVELSPGGKVRICDPVAVAPSPAAC
jgi:type IV fimbrial biogenesis protein FimT